MYHVEKNQEGKEEIVIDGWEKGIATSPYNGIGHLKNVNITTVPGEASVNFARTLQSQVAITSGTFTADATNDVQYTGSTPLLPGTWVLIAAGSTITNLTSTTGAGGSGYFFIKNIVSGTSTNGTFSIALTYGGTAINNFGTTGTATFATYQMYNPIVSSFVVPNSTQYYMCDSIGLIWTYPYSPGSGTYWGLIDPPSASHRANSGIFSFYGYLFRASDGSGGGGGITSLEYKSITSLGGSWTTFGGGGMATTGVPHQALVGVQDNVAWICDGQYINKLSLVAGQTFDPINSATYTYPTAPRAIILWQYETAQCLAELGSNLVIGALSNNLYLYDRSQTNATSAYYVLPLVEGNVQTMVTAGNVVYLFVGNKGNIYVTSGAVASPVLTIPDYVTGGIEPYYVWGAATFMRGRIFFSLQDSNGTTGAVWSFVPVQGAFIQQDLGNSLRLENVDSAGLYTGLVTAILPLQGSTGQQAQGAQYFSAWTNGTTHGIDSSASTPYTGGQAVIETDLLPVGTFLNKRTFNRIEYKIATPLATNESVSIAWRAGITGSFTALTGLQTETSAVDGFSAVSGYYPVNFQNAQWVQLQITLTSTASSPSYVRLKQVRLS